MNKLVERTRLKEKQARQDEVITQNFLKLSVGTQFKEAMETINVKHEKKIKP